MIKKILNSQLRLTDAVNRLNITIRQKLILLAREEIKSRLKLFKTLNKRAFTYLIDIISIYVIKLIASEWEDIKN